MIEVRWTRAWLIEVPKARKALERANRVDRMRKAQIYALPNPIASVGKGSARDRMRAVDEMVDTEAAPPHEDCRSIRAGALHIHP